MSSSSLPAMSGAGGPPPPYPLVEASAPSNVMGAIASFLTADEVCSLRRVSRHFKASDTLWKVNAQHRIEQQWACDIGFSRPVVARLREAGISISRLPEIDLDPILARREALRRGMFDWECMVPADLPHSIMRGSILGDPILFFHLRGKPGIMVEHETLPPRDLEREEGVLVIQACDSSLDTFLFKVEVEKAIRGNFPPAQLRFEGVRGSFGASASRMGRLDPLSFERMWSMRHEEIAQHSGHQNDKCLLCPWRSQGVPSRLYGGFNYQTFSDILAGRDSVVALAQSPFQNARSDLLLQTVAQRAKAIARLPKNRFARAVAVEKNKRAIDTTIVVVCCIVISAYLYCVGKFMEFGDD